MVLGFAVTPGPSVNINSRHSIAASDEPSTEKARANVTSYHPCTLVGIGSELGRLEYMLGEY